MSKHRLMRELKNIGLLLSLWGVFVSASTTLRAQSNSQQVVRAPPTILERDKLFLFPEKNIIIGGECSAQFTFRFDNLRSLEGRDARCINFFASKNSVVRMFANGYSVYSLDTDVLKYERLDDQRLRAFNNGTFLSDEKSFIGFGWSSSDVWRVDLEGIRSIKKLGSHKKDYRVTKVVVSESSNIGYSIANRSSSSEVIVWDFDSGRKLATYEADAAGISSDGNLIAIARRSIPDDSYSERDVWIRQSRDGKVVATTKTPSHPTKEMKFLSNSEVGMFHYIEASQKYDFVAWDFRAQSSRTLLHVDYGFFDGPFEVDVARRKLLSLQSNGVHRFDLETGLPDSDNPSAPSLKATASAASPNGSAFAMVGKNLVALINRETNSVARTIALAKPVENLISVAFADEGKLILGDNSGVVYALDLHSETISHVYGKAPEFSFSEGPGVSNISVSHDRRLIAFAIEDKAVVLNIANGEVVRTLKIAKTYGSDKHRIAFVDADQRLIVAAQNFQLFDLRNGTQLINEEVSVAGGARYITRNDFTKESIVGFYSPVASAVYVYRDGKIIRRVGGIKARVNAHAGRASAAVAIDAETTVVGYDRQIRTSGADFGSISDPIATHSADIVSFHRNDQGRLISISADGEIRVTNAANGSTLVSTRIYADGSWVALTPEGFFSGSPEAIRRLLVRISASEVVPLDRFYQALYRPDLVREKLAGDPNGKVKAAAALLDLNKVMASGVPPKVAITSPNDASAASSDQITVSATVADQGGGLGRVEWRVNGVTVGTGGRGFERVDGSGVAVSVPTAKIQAVSQTLALGAGDNVIEVLAYNSTNLIASDAAKITVTLAADARTTPPNLYVVAVGVNDYYDSRLRLSYAVPDAIALAEGFRKSGSGLYGSVDVTTVLDKDVTVANLDRVFGEISKKVQPRDVFVFFLAGHGKTKNGRYYFLPRDFRYEDESSIEKTGLDQDRFQAWFAKVPALKSILLYDTCESGSLTGNTRGSDLDERLGALNRMARATGRTFLTATTDDAPALEGFRGHGVFTYALLDALERGDVNGNGIIEVSELADYIDAKVPDYSFEAFKLRQIPQRSIVGNNFALTNKAAILASAGSAAAASIPTKATHVVIKPSEVKAAVGDTSETVSQLAPGTQVRLIETANGWTLVAREGRKLGYVREGSLIGLQ
ncbi:polysaccharide deacetylase [Bradyrhizobiaceae bacterium SG-6C]|nr:polysaccharide deacetylase [Bradyrhizobiaceae bacterium SG-6C]